MCGDAPELELEQVAVVLVPELSVDEVGESDERLAAVCGFLGGELDVLLGDALVLTEVLLVHHGEGEVYTARHPGRHVLKCEIGADCLVIGHEADAPALVSVHEVPGVDVRREVGRHGRWDDERKDLRVEAVVELHEPVQLSHV